MVMKESDSSVNIVIDRPEQQITRGYRDNTVILFFKFPYVVDTGWDSPKGTIGMFVWQNDNKKK